MRFRTVLSYGKREKLEGFQKRVCVTHSLVIRLYEQRAGL
jgi:hypothetical protein